MQPTSEPSAPGRRLARRGLVAGAVVGYALIAALCRPLTAPALVAVLIPGVPLFWLGVRSWPRRRRQPVRPREAGALPAVEAGAPPVGRQSVAAWVGLAAVGGVVELALRLGPNDLAHPTLSTLADPVLATYPGRVVGYMLWLGAGVWLVSR